MKSAGAGSSDAPLGDDDRTADERLYDAYLDAAVEGDLEDPSAFCARHGAASPDLLALLEALRRSLAPAADGPATVVEPLVPLNLDFTSFAVLDLAGTPLFPDAVGVLSAAGTAATTMNVPFDVAASLSGPAGTTVVVALDAALNVVLASNPVLIPFP